MHVRPKIATFPGFTLVLRPIQTASARRCICQTMRLPDNASARQPSARRCVYQTAVCQTPDCQTRSARRHHPDSRMPDATSARGCLPRSQPLPLYSDQFRRCLPDDASARQRVCQTTDCQTAVSQMRSARQPSARRHHPDSRLPDAICQRVSARHHICQTAVCQRVSARHRVCQTAVCQMPSTRWCLPDAVCQTPHQPSARRPSANATSVRQPSGIRVSDRCGVLSQGLLTYRN